jgi:Type I phosphodiesterase / nucleotide pyrophosphatase
LKQHKPRLMYLSLGETDEWAHAGKYADYLRAAKLVDGYLGELWQSLQSMPQYRGTTTMIFLPDHGRGEGPKEWKSHGQKLPNSKYIWLAFLGPDTPAMGERKSAAPVTQSQVAGTMTALLGEDYRASVPKAGTPIAEVIARK